MNYSIIPQSHITINNKLANTLTRDIINKGAIDLTVSRSNRRQEIITSVMVSYEGDNSNTGELVRFTSYDREIHDAIVSLFVVGNNLFTTEMVYRAMNGLNKSEKVSGVALNSIKQSVEKSRNLRLNLDFTQEAGAYKKDCKTTYTGYLLECDKVTITTGGQIKEAYQLLQNPILYDYAQVSGQILSIPIILLQTKRFVRNTSDVIVLRGYLLRQIEWIKSPKSKRKNNNISYEKLFLELDIFTDSFSNYNEKTRKVREHVEKILNGWVDCGYIKGYERYKSGKTIKGVSIFV